MEDAGSSQPAAPWFASCVCGAKGSPMTEEGRRILTVASSSGGLLARNRLGHPGGGAGVRRPPSRPHEGVPSGPNEA